MRTLRRFKAEVAIVSTAALVSATLIPSLAAAYNPDTHSRIAELAVRAMRTSHDGSLTPPAGEEALFEEYLTDAEASVARLEQIKTGLPKKLQEGGVAPIPGGGASEYPYSVAGSVNCPLISGEARDLTRLGEFRIVDLDYAPRQDASPCGLTPFFADSSLPDGIDIEDPAQVDHRVAELVLGWQALSADLQIDDTVLWVKPTLTGLGGVLTEALSLTFEYGVGSFLLPFVLIFKFIFEGEVDIDGSYDLTRQYNPVDELAGAIPGVGDIRGQDFVGLWHFEHVDAGIHRYNETRGMWYPGAGAAHPGALDVAIMAGATAIGVALNAYSSNGPSRYGQYDRIHRTKPQWQAHSTGVTEFSPIHNLARYGWEKFNSDPSTAAGLAWPLHAIGDASAPQHVTGTTAWGHRTYEDWVSEHSQEVLPRAFDSQNNPITGAQALQTAQLARAMFLGFKWWKRLREGEDVAALVHDLAGETRQTVKDQGDWPFYDWPSTLYATPGLREEAHDAYESIMTTERAAQTQGLLENGIGAAIALLTVAGKKVPTVPRGAIDCPTDQEFGFTQITETGTDPETGQPYTYTHTVSGCRTPSIQQPLPALSASGADVASLPPAPSCATPCESTEECAFGAECSDGCCIGTVPK